jgi:4-amino-4-deoxy-L-arabinose transferase-like glycosyltransferase
MSLIRSTSDATSHVEPAEAIRGRRFRFGLKHFSYLRSWEFYLILLVAGFLRLYQPGAGEFDADQAVIFGLAHRAVQSGLWPVISNRASIGIENPPAVLYMLMLPAAITGNPVLATIMTALLNVVAVLLTYIFVRRYYGRFAGTTAALLYAAAPKLVEYSRFIWQQNMLAPFVVLFFFALFWGVVDRRKGWFCPAVILLSIAIQLHETAFLLIFPLIAALILAPRTVRLRDVLLAVLSFLILFSPYILWEFMTKFSDITILLNSVRHHISYPNTAVYLFKLMLSPDGLTSYSQIPAQPSSLLHQLGPMLGPLRYAIQLLVAGGIFLAGFLALFPVTRPSNAIHSDEVADEQEQEKHSHSSTKFAHNPILIWWSTFYADPYRRGLALLCIWQIIPLLLLTQQSLLLFPYYLLVLFPGPFILIAILLATIAHWLRQRSTSNSSLSFALRFGMYAFTGCFLLAQILACTASLLDVTNGVYVNTASYNSVPTYNSLGSLQDALNEADQVAQQRHIHRVYIATDEYIADAMRYLATQMKTPTTLFDDSQCLVLPAPSAGPALLLVNPYAQMTRSLLRSYASATLVAQPARLGSLPFSLYLVQSNPVVGQPLTSEVFKNNLQLLSLQSAQYQLPTSYGGPTSNANLLVSRWLMLHSAQPASGTTYTYHLRATDPGTASTNSQTQTQASFSAQSACTLTSMQAGDQLFAAFALPDALPVSSNVTLQGEMYATAPYVPTFGPLRLETDQVRNGSYVTLQTTGGSEHLTVPVS